MSQHFVSLRTTSIIEQASGDRPSFDARVCQTFGSKPYQVFLFFRGDAAVELVSAQSMLTAIKVLKAKLGDRLKVNIEWCEQTRSFRNKYLSCPAGYPIDGRQRLPPLCAVHRIASHRISHFLSQCLV